MPRNGHRAAGSATVEFALVLPLVLVVVLALVQVGLLVRDRLLVEAAARAAARAAAVQDDPAAISAAALAAAPGLDPTRASVETTRVGERGSPVTVRFLYAAPFRVPLVGWLVGSGVTLTAEAAARQEFG
jgi:Flp pilus assembly protein TadG